jgi:hypothetical protein|tara:strand:- start:4793 stop:4915 length:123 start_codon:yes stop_codon:yes gene_type:complete
MDWELDTWYKKAVYVIGWINVAWFLFWILVGAVSVGIGMV